MNEAKLVPDHGEGNEGLKHTDTLPTLQNASGSSFTDSEPTTPTNAAATPTQPPKKPTSLFGVFTPTKSGKLSSIYDKSKGDPSPPKVGGKIVDMELSDVDSKMVDLLFFSINKNPEEDWYKKLGYIIAKGLHEEVQKQEPWCWLFTLRNMLDANTAVGQRFETMYRSDGDELSTCREGKTPGWQDQFLREKFPEAFKQESAYLVFTDAGHRNMVYFDRHQQSGNCFVHGPALWLWYLQLWKNPKICANDIPLIDISKFFRNTYSAGRLYEYLVQDKGGRALKAADEFVMNSTRNAKSIWHPESFDDIKQYLKDFGPGLVEVDQLHGDFQESGKLKYSGKPEGKVEGHAMVLVGVFQVGDSKEHDVYLLLQNFWPEKPFVAVSQAYLFNSGTTIWFMDKGFDFRPGVHMDYMKKTCSMRYAATSPRLERPVEHVYYRGGV